ncbi:hypothetical protein E3E31_11805 [Thermococcus sp. M39]|uniref:hypothetical protein n=1 Tax=unclassified Thermococcus TaxID=2627626 RepID=UPI001439AA4B|nr:MULTISPECIES: hypothetical protein [unclassified Thermococcus]NJE09192.1 hypothetical protein [Thermococcus sp. M39]NJE13772.1 hypothetical protein [Thermococcus sp. LS2]
MKQNLREDIIGILRREGYSTVAILTRKLNERGIDCTRQKVERVLRDLIKENVIEVYYINANHRRHYRLR